MILGYALTGPDNDSTMVEGTPPAVLCPTCGTRVNRDYHRPDFAPTVTRYDVSFTYDNYCIVSARFREFCLRERYEALDFVPLAQGFSWFRPLREVAFDAERRGTRFVDWCDTCQQHAAVVVAYPPVLRDESRPLPDGFFRTDLEFGDRKKAPLILLGPETKAKLTRERLKGLELIPIKPLGGKSK